MALAKCNSDSCFNGITEGSKPYTLAVEQEDKLMS